MHPILIQVGWFTIYSYGFMLALSFLAGIFVASYRARKIGLPPAHILDLSVYIILAAVIGSRLLYVVFHLNEYRNIFDMFALWQGGATLYGGLVLAVLASYLFARKHALSFLLLADVVAPSIALGIMLTRIGCFLSGCCYGKVTTLPWAVQFPSGCAADIYAREQALALSLPRVGLHPTQLYSSAYGLIIFGLLMGVGGRLKKQGGTFGLFLVLYGISRFSIDFFRYYESNMRVLMGLTLNQVLSAGLFLIGLFLLFRPAGKAPLSAG
jgi:phosphatidylglycerol:prolipoprotein diacylglycerol transferase